jgi:hypothetical protein
MFAGAWNCVLTLGALFFATLDPAHFRFVGIEQPGTLLPYYALLPQVTLFGIGYALLARDLTRNHAILALGAAGKTVFFLAVITYYFRGEINLVLVALLIGDMVQVGIFLDFLRRMRALSHTVARLPPALFLVGNRSGEWRDLS